MPIPTRAAASPARPAAPTPPRAVEALAAAEAGERCNRRLAALTAEARVEWALEHLPGAHVLSSSFGVQAAVSLHMVSRRLPEIPVVLVDTGYLFPETYQFIDRLTAELGLNLRVYRSERSAAWQEAREGRRWEHGLEALSAYNRENKVEPMERALRELDAGTWFAGLRREQSRSRAGVQFLSWGDGRRCKVHPIADWTDHDVHRYLQEHRLPYHPLRDKGYVSLGDVHSTRPLHEVASVEETRFAGLKRECGLHEIDLAGL